MITDDNNKYLFTLTDGSKILIHAHDKKEAIEIFNTNVHGIMYDKIVQEYD